ARASLPRPATRQAFAGEIQQVFALAEGGFSLDRRLGPDVAVVEVVGRQVGDQPVPGGGRVDAIPVQIAVRIGADGQGDLVEAGAAGVGQAEGPRIAGQGVADLVQVHQDDVAVGIGGGD